MSKEEMPKGNTGIKLESFIFDVFPAAERMAVLEVVREDEFGPVKNAPGSPDGDSPDTALQLMLQHHQRWLHGVGVATVKPTVEISPLVSYGGEGVHSLLAEKDLLTALKEGQVVSVAHGAKEATTSKGQPAILRVTAVSPAV